MRRQVVLFDKEHEKNKEKASVCGYFISITVLIVSIVVFMLYFIGLNTHFNLHKSTSCEDYFHMDITTNATWKHINFGSKYENKYKLYQYDNEEIINPKTHSKIPILFIPGHAGSYSQAKPLISTFYNIYYSTRLLPDHKYFLSLLQARTNFINQLTEKNTEIENLMSIINIWELQELQKFWKYRGTNINLNDDQEVRKKFLDLLRKEDEKFSQEGYSVPVYNSKYPFHTFNFINNSLNKFTIENNENDGIFFDFYTIDFNEEFSAFHGYSIEDQSNFVIESINHILSSYQRYKSYMIIPESVFIIAHSMGGVVARSAVMKLHQIDENRFLHNLTSSNEGQKVNFLLTLGTPHIAPPLPFDHSIATFYSNLNNFYHNEKDNRLSNLTILSITSGYSDNQVISELSELPSYLFNQKNSYFYYTTAIPYLWEPTTHLGLCRCGYLMEIISKTLISLIDLNTKQISLSQKYKDEIIKFYYSDPMPNYFHLNSKILPSKIQPSIFDWNNFNYNDSDLGFQYSSINSLLSIVEKEKIQFYIQREKTSGVFLSDSYRFQRFPSNIEIDEILPSDSFLRVSIASRFIFPNDIPSELKTTLNINLHLLFNIIHSPESKFSIFSNLQYGKDFVVYLVQKKGENENDLLHRCNSIHLPQRKGKTMKNIIYYNSKELIDYDQVYITIHNYYNLIRKGIVYVNQVPDEKPLEISPLTSVFSSHKIVLKDQLVRFFNFSSITSKYTPLRISLNLLGVVEKDEVKLKVEPTIYLYTQTLHSNEGQFIVIKQSAPTFGFLQEPFFEEEEKAPNTLRVLDGQLLFHQTTDLVTYPSMMLVADPGVEFELVIKLDRKEMLGQLFRLYTPVISLFFLVVPLLALSKSIHNAKKRNGRGYFSALFSSIKMVLPYLLLISLLHFLSLTIISLYTPHFEEWEEIEVDFRRLEEDITDSRYLHDDFNFHSYFSLSGSTLEMFTPSKNSYILGLHWWIYPAIYLVSCVLISILISFPLAILNFLRFFVSFFSKKSRSSPQDEKSRYRTVRVLIILSTLFSIYNPLIVLVMSHLVLFLSLVSSFCLNTKFAI